MLKIAALAENGLGLDVTLMSENLNDVLVQLCDLVAGQQTTIDSLQKVIETMAVKSEIQEMLSKQSSDMDLLKTKTDELTSTLTVRIGKISSETKSSLDTLSESIQAIKTEIITELESKQQASQGDYFILAQQVKEIQKQNTSNKRQFSSIREDLVRFDSLFEAMKDQNLDVVAKRVDKLETDFRRVIETQQRIQGELDQKTTQMSSRSSQFETDVKNDIRCLQIQVEEARRLVIDAPSLDLDGVISTEALIRAIQRDSRRIDNFNEMVLSVKRENDNLRVLFNDATNCIGRFQAEVQHFVEEHNFVKSVLVTQVDHSYVHSDNVRKEVRLCQRTLSDLVDVSSKSVNSISSAFLQIYQFLNKITSRVIPNPMSFDEELLEFQRLCDLILDQQESKSLRDDLSFALIERKNRTKLVGEHMTDDIRFSLLNDFKLTPVNIPVHDMSDINVRASRIFNPKAVHERSETGNVVEGQPSQFEVQQSLGSISRSVEQVKASISELREGMTRRIEDKADSVQVERILERIRSMKLVANEDVNSLKKRLGTFLRRDEVEGVVRRIMGSQPMKGAARTVGVIGSGVKPVIPELPTQTADDQIFGGAHSGLK